MESEDLKILSLIIGKLETQHDFDKSAFRAELSEEVEEFPDCEGGWFHAMSKNMTIDWHPKYHSWNPKIHNDDIKVYLNYDISCQTVSINIGGERRDIFLDGGSHNKDIKKRFVKLFHSITEWQSEELPRRKRETWINATTKAFPDLLDHLILEEIDEHDEEGDN